MWPASYTATVSWLARHDDLSLTCLMRDGTDVWCRKYLPHLKQDYSRLQPGEMYVADHSQLDLFCTYKGRQIRPWLTAIQDLRTRCIVGWHVEPVPHQDAILSALRMAFRDWAIPSVMRIDNGKDFTSKAITGYTKKERDRLKRVLGGDWQQIVKRSENLIECTDSRWLGITGELEIELIYAIPYSPWSKGTLERWFGTCHDQHDKLYATYCGNSPRNKPECLETIRTKHPDAVPTIEEVGERIGQYLDVYHRTGHRGLDGLTPLAVWSTAARLRRAVGDALAFLMDVRGLYKVGGNGVSLKVGAGTYSYGDKSQALKRWAGRKVLVALDSNDVSHAWAYTPDREKRKLIARLESNDSIEPYTTADAAREAIAEKKREQSVMHKAKRGFARQTMSMTERLRENNQAKRQELLATGTDDAGQPRIAPVRTGFEGCSKPSQSGFEIESYRPVESGDLTDLFDHDQPFGSGGDADDQDMEDLFDDDPTEVDPDQGLEGL